MKRLLFISHAAPEDNYLAAWLASKLRLLGYEVWVDVKDLRAGSSFWNEIELKMRDESCCFLALVSQSYIEKSRNKNSGVFSEITLAKTLSRSLDNYIIPIKVDSSSYDDFPINMLPLDTIDFSRNWGTGLNDLVEEIVTRKIHKTESDDTVLAQWYNFQKSQKVVRKKEESYSSNWFGVTLPETVYVYKFHGDYKKLWQSIPYAYVRNGDYILGFFDESNIDINHTFYDQIESEWIKENGSIRLSNGDEIKDAPQKLVSLLNKSISYFFYLRENFGAFSGSGKKKIFYPKFDQERSGYISLKAFGKRGRKLYSKNGKMKWRFGLSFIFQLEPFSHLVTNYHLVSSNENGLLEGEDHQKARRSIPSEWFNRDWYERILALLHLASEFSKDLKLKIPVGGQLLVIDLEPVQFHSEYGYDE